MFRIAYACCLFALLFANSMACAQETDRQKDFSKSITDVYQKYYQEKPGNYEEALELYQKALEQSYFDQIGKVKPSEYWIGVQCEPMIESSFFSKDIGGLVAVKGGLKVSHVSEDSPAASIEMKVGDIILWIEDKVVLEVDELVTIVGEKGESSFSGVLIRDEKIVEFEVTPAKRPVDNKQLPADHTNPNVLRYWNQPNGLAEGYSATIVVKNGVSPKITIKKGDQTWTSNGGDVSELPKETQLFAHSINQAVSSLVSYNNLKQSYDFWRFNNAYGNQKLPAATYWRFPNANDGIDKKIDKLQKQVEELSKLVSDLKKERE